MYQGWKFYEMDVEVILHDSGELLPILLDDDGMPIPLPNEFILSKRHASSNTLIRNLREIKLLYEWFQIHKIDLYERLIKKKPFTEAEIIGSLVEFLRKDHDKRHKTIKIAVKPDTFNQRLITIRQFLDWYILRCTSGRYLLHRITINTTSHIRLDLFPYLIAVL